MHCTAYLRFSDGMTQDLDNKYHPTPCLFQLDLWYTSAGRVRGQVPRVFWGRVS